VGERDAGALNGAVGFDPETLAPTYTLTLDGRGRRTPSRSRGGSGPTRA
jgi:hypothetical protein